MNMVTHFFLGLFVGTFFFGENIFKVENILIILIFSNALDLDHLYRFRTRPKNHLRTFIQEPFALLIIGVPAGVISGYFLGFEYFWTVLALFSAHIVGDYLCIFETWPLDPFNTKIVKKEGMGFIITFDMILDKRRGEFPHKINEIFILISLIAADAILFYFIFL
ncbi:MAG: hypothetical protein ACTSO9_04350 [Candidatus Helarchaeota archaeon]